MAISLASLNRATALKPPRILIHGVHGVGKTTFAAGMLVTFELAGQRFYALNGGPNDRFNESVSLLVECETQEEVDTLWSQLTDGGTEAPCGWLKDRYGLAWQIAPTRLLELVTGADRKAAESAMRAMFEMKKIVIDDIERAVGTR